MTNRCEGKTKRGAACVQRAEVGSAYCLLHDPARAEERLALCRERGAAGKRARDERAQLRAQEIRQAVQERVVLDTTERIRQVLEVEIGNVRSSHVDSDKRANAVARLCSVALASLKAAELEQEVERLRAALAEAQSGTGRLVTLVWPDKVAG